MIRYVGQQQQHSPSVVESICSILWPNHSTTNHGSSSTTTTTTNNRRRNNHHVVVVYSIVEFLKAHVPTFSDPERILFSSSPRISTTTPPYDTVDTEDDASLSFLLQHTRLVIPVQTQDDTAGASRIFPNHSPTTNIQQQPTRIPRLDRFEYGNRQSLSSLISDVVKHLIVTPRRRQPRSLETTTAFLKHRSSNCNVLSAGYGMIPNVGATRLQQIRLNAGTDWCRHSKLFQHLHGILGDDILRYILLNTSMFVPIGGDGKETSTIMSTKNDAWNYWQITGPPMTQWNRHIRCGNSRENQNRQTRKRQISWNDDDLDLSESKPQDGHIRLHQHQKKKRKKRKRPIRSLSQNNRHANNAQEFLASSPLSPSASISHSTLWYTNSYFTKTVRDGFMEYDSPKALWHAMTSEYQNHIMNTRSSSSSSSKHCDPKLVPSPEALAMCTELLRRHRTFDYHRTLERLCPLPPTSNTQEATTATGQNDDIAKLAQSFCDTHHQVVPYCVQAVAHVFPPSFWCHSSSSQPKRRRHANKATTSSGTNNQTVVLQQTIPTFVTLRRNEHMPNKTLMRNLQINRMKWLYSVLGIDISNNHQEKNKEKKMSRVDHERLHLLVLSIVRWVFRKYLIPLLRTAFYVTDGQEYGKRLLFYRRPVWALFRARSMQKLLGQSSDHPPQDDGEKSQYVELKESDAIQRLANQQMGLSTLRLLPKITGVRPIAMLSRSEPLLVPVGIINENNKASGKRKWSEIALKQEDVRDYNDFEDVESPLSTSRIIQNTTRIGSVDQEHNRQVKMIVNANPIPTNAMLQDAMAVLNYEVNEKMGSFGAGLPGLHHFFIRYRRFLKHWKNQSEISQRKKLLFGSVDIRHCYDNINQTHLLKILDTILSRNDYIVEKYSVMHPRDGKSQVCRRHKRIARPLEELVPFSVTARKLAEEHRGSIFIDGVSTIAVSKQQVLSQVREHLTSHLVVAKARFGNRYFWQATGIPQGSILSSLLCNVYYGDVERRILQDYFRDGAEDDLNVVQDKDSLDLLARMVDDFMLVTTENQNLETFFATMYQGDRSLGVEVNREKSKSSIDVKIKNRDGRVETVKATKSSARLFPWCGLLFDTMTGEVRNDYSRFYGGKGIDTLTVERGNNEGEQLFLQMKLFVRPRCIPIMFDPCINTLQTQAYNFYQMMVFAAVKTSDYLAIWRGEVAKKSSLLSNAPFIVQCAETLFDLSFHLIKGRLVNEFKKGFMGEPMSGLIPLWMATKLGRKAFFDVFIRISHDDMRSLAERYFKPVVDQGKSHETSTGLDLEKISAAALADIQLQRLLNSKLRECD